MSWSLRITFLYLGFVALIVSLVIISSNNKEELVAKDYYTQELAYQQKIEAILNEKSLAESIRHHMNETVITLSLPASLKAEELTGEIFFYCPSSSANDVKLKMHFDNNGLQEISKSQLKPGAYKMCLSWGIKGKDFFREEIINIK